MAQTIEFDLRDQMISGHGQLTGALVRPGMIGKAVRLSLTEQGGLAAGFVPHEILMKVRRDGIPAEALVRPNRGRLDFSAIAKSGHDGQFWHVGGHEALRTAPKFQDVVQEVVTALVQAKQREVLLVSAAEQEDNWLFKNGRITSIRMKGRSLGDVRFLNGGIVGRSDDTLHYLDDIAPDGQWKRIVGIPRQQGEKVEFLTCILPDGRTAITTNQAVHGVDLTEIAADGEPSFFAHAPRSRRQPIGRYVGPIVVGDGAVFAATTRPNASGGTILTIWPAAMDPAASVTRALAHTAAPVRV